MIVDEPSPTARRAGALPFGQLVWVARLVEPWTATMLRSGVLFRAGRRSSARPSGLAGPLHADDGLPGGWPGLACPGSDGLLPADQHEGATLRWRRVPPSSGDDAEFGVVVGVVVGRPVSRTDGQFRIVLPLPDKGPARYRLRPSRRLRLLPVVLQQPSRSGPLRVVYAHVADVMPASSSPRSRSAEAAVLAAGSAVAA